MGRRTSLDIGGRTLLIRHWKARTGAKEIAYILNVSDDLVRLELRVLRASGLISDRAVVKHKTKLTAKPKSDNKDPRHKRAMRICLRCGISFNSTHCGNRLCKNCATSAARDRSIK